MLNVHIMFIKSRNTKKHLRLLSSGTKLFITFELKGFFDIRREIPSFYTDFSICPPRPRNMCAPAARPRRASESHPSSSDGKTQLTDFFQITQNPPHTLPVYDVIRIPLFTFPIWGFTLTSLNDTSSPRAWTPALVLHLTNPCAKWKVLSLTKPKGKIYKTKSLGHYITLYASMKYFSFVWNHQSAIILSFLLLHS